MAQVGVRDRQLPVRRRRLLPLRSFGGGATATFSLLVVSPATGPWICTMNFSVSNSSSMPDRSASISSGSRNFSSQAPGSRRPLDSWRAYTAARFDAIVKTHSPSFHFFRFCVFMCVYSTSRRCVAMTEEGTETMNYMRAVRKMRPRRGIRNMVGLEDTRYVDQMNDEWVIIQRFFPSTRLNFSGR